MIKVNASERLKADKQDAERYRAIRAEVQARKSVTLKAQQDNAAFDRMIDKVLRGK